MKNNQQKNRNQHPRQNQQPQRRDLMALMANIDITDGMVSIPRDEYDELQYRSALVDILQRLFETGGRYAIGNLLENIFEESDGEKEDK